MTASMKVVVGMTRLGLRAVRAWWSYVNSDVGSADGDIVEYKGVPEVTRQSPTATDKKDVFTFSDCEGVLKCWETASYKVTTFEKANIVVSYKKVQQSFNFYYCLVWETTLDLLQDVHIES
ncbi:hypothetical protein OE88DRAFT_1647318 [Heliocybe sulcata]|uniref:Uncharacterized protein n=1 Tax=Heliocybe sulcata TaxID=5364 RepID=A0A5C3MSH2_9AGAM|nr:hypothetical protein OE88DRAFT_1647318 [Heliocybe sulcata]